MMSSVVELRPRTTGNISLQSSDDTVTDSMLDDAFALVIPQNQTSLTTDSLFNEVSAVENPTTARKGRNQTTVVAEQINRRDEMCHTDATSSVQNVDHGYGIKGKHQGKICSQPQMPHGYLKPSYSVIKETGPTVFFTYLESDDSSRDILDMSNYLESKGMNIRIDVNETPLRAMSINNWLNDNVENSNFIIVCVNKMYNNKIAKGNYDKGNQMHYHAYFIFNQLQTEYMMNNCLNYRVLPVLVGGATLKDVPLFLLNTTVYQWPQSKSQLVDRIFKRQEYTSPELGVEPVAIFDKCTN